MLFPKPRSPHHRYPPLRLPEQPQLARQTTHGDSPRPPPTPAKRPEAQPDRRHHQARQAARLRRRIPRRSWPPSSPAGPTAPPGPPSPPEAPLPQPQAAPPAQRGPPSPRMSSLPLTPRGRVRRPGCSSHPRRVGNRSPVRSLSHRHESMGSLPRVAEHQWNVRATSHPPPRWWHCPNLSNSGHFARWTGIRLRPHRVNRSTDGADSLLDEEPGTSATSTRPAPLPRPPPRSRTHHQSRYRPRQPVVR